MSPTSPKRVELPESAHPPVPNAIRIGKAAGDRRIRVSVILNRKTTLDIAALKGRQLSRAEYAASYGASQKDFDAVRAFAKINGLSVDEKKSSLLRRRVELHGTINALNKAFGVDLNDYEPSGAKRGGARFHAIVGSVTVPEELSGSVEAVLGLDNRPIATPKIRVRGTTSAAANPDAGTFIPPQVAQVYNFPTAPTGTSGGAGQTIGIIELGGGYSPTDITSYFANTIGIKAPSVTDVILDGGSNDPTNANSADAEVLLDIEVAGSVAPGANIVVYFTTNTDQGFQDAISTAIHDTTNNPGVISISWGGPESTWSQTAMNSMDTTCQSAAALGITITVASGDSGSSDGETGNNVDFPASSPHVLGFGGHGQQRPAPIRGGLERPGLRWRGHRWRRQHDLSITCLAGRCRRAASERDQKKEEDQRRSSSSGEEGCRRRRSRGSRRRRRCLSGNRLSDSGRRPAGGRRRHERRGSALGRADRAA